MPYSLLYCDSILFDSADLASGVGAHFYCPLCDSSMENRYWFNHKASVGTVFPQSFDMNAQVAFPIPRHVDKAKGTRCPASGDVIRLYVAIHRHSTSDVSVCIQKSSGEGAPGISATWWT